MRRECGLEKEGADRTCIESPKTRPIDIYKRRTRVITPNMNKRAMDA